MAVQFTHAIDALSLAPSILFRILGLLVVRIPLQKTNPGFDIPFRKEYGDDVRDIRKDPGDRRIRTGVLTPQNGRVVLVRVDDHNQPQAGPSVSHRSESANFLFETTKNGRTISGLFNSKPSLEASHFQEP